MKKIIIITAACFGIYVLGFSWIAYSIHKDRQNMREGVTQGTEKLRELEIKLEMAIEIQKEVFRNNVDLLYQATKKLRSIPDLAGDEELLRIETRLKEIKEEY